MKKKLIPGTIVLLLLFTTGCGHNPETLNEYIYIKPDYSNISLRGTSDTLRFSLTEHSTTAVTSANYFIDKGREYLSLYDRVSKLINIYSFPEGVVKKTIPVKAWLQGTNLDKASIHVINFDSILICTRERIVMLDSSSLIRKKIEIEKSKPLRIPDMGNETPPIIKNGVLYTRISPSVNETSISEHKKWKLLFGFDLRTDQKDVYYHLPELYQRNLYGYSFMLYGYCVNDKGNFVFSFPADTNIYETDLNDYNKTYFAKSQFQQGNIEPVSEELIEKGFSFREYSLRDSYGFIFYDPAGKRYLRMAKQKMDDSTLLARNRIRKRSVLVLDHNFKIIGEGETPGPIDFNSLLFTKNGSIYGKLAGTKDSFITYVRLEYSDAGAGSNSTIVKNQH